MFKVGLKIVLKPDPAWRVDTGLEPGQVEKKIRKKKIWHDPVRLSQKPGCNPLLFFFLLKRYRFDLKKLTRMTRSKLGIQVLDWTGCKNYSINICFLKYFLFKNILK
jgi:hypothetical protein